MTTHPDELHGSTQCERLLAHLEAGNTVTHLDSWRELGIPQPARRVCDLRKGRWSGRRCIDVRTRTVTVRNRWGEEAHVAEYFLERAKPAPTEQQGLAL